MMENQIVKEMKASLCGGRECDGKWSKCYLAEEVGGLKVLQLHFLSNGWTV